MDKILIASPNPLFRHVMARLLRDECDALDSATSVEEFEKQSFTDVYRLIITSFAAPLINGTDLARRLHRRRTPSVVFLVTDRLTESEAVTYIESGADQLISMPVDRTRLKRKVREVIDRAIRE